MTSLRHPHRLLCPLLLAVALCQGACDSDDADADITFHVVATEGEGGEMSVTITHNGSNRDTYCGFAVEGTQDSPSDIQQHITDYISAIDTTGYGHYTYLRYLNEQKKRVIRLGSLKAHTTYTYIVFGMTEYGEQYGTPAHTSFTTGESGMTVMEDPAWSLTYKGAALWNDNYYTRIAVDVADTSSASFFVGVYETALAASYSSEANFLAYAVDDYHRRWDSYDRDAFWRQDLQLHTASTDHYTHLDTNTGYVAYAIGLNSSGAATGQYAKSEPFVVDEYPMLDGYARLVYPLWKYKWTLTSNIEKEKSTAYLREGIRNETVRMCWKYSYTSYLFVTNYAPHDASLTVKAQTIKSSALEKVNRTYERGSLNLRGWYIDEQGDTLISQAEVIARGEPQSDGTYRFTSAFEGARTGMAYILTKTDRTNIILRDASVTFPFVITKQ